MLALTHASIATVEELFRYKKQDFQLEDFPGYTPDQWGIKAHNRPWVEEVGKFTRGQKIIEVGGGYSLFPKYLCEKYGLEAWIGDDFGSSTAESLWSRWGNPNELPNKYPCVKYVFEPFGRFLKKYPDKYFDRIFSISTLEHIPFKDRLNFFKDMNRCLKPGGMQLHTIDISFNLSKCIFSFLSDTFPILSNISKNCSEIRSWIKIMKKSGIKIATTVPNSIFLLKKSLLVESPDVVYRFYPPMNEPKPYNPNASLLLIIEDR
jgi:ubiquinone/menaquinone biosynthesis C-methylase UbiE